LAHLTVFYYSTNAECAGICLSKEDCYAFEFGRQKCKLMNQPNIAFDIKTDNGEMAMCLDHQNWNPITVYADNSNIPPMCPSKLPIYFDIYIQNTVFNFGIRILKELDT
jgi:hypothetical protein